MKKLLSILLSVVLTASCSLPAFAAYTPAESYEAYEADKVAANDSAYIDSLTLDQIAGILLDYADAWLAGIATDVTIADGLTINTVDMLDLNTLTAWGYDALSKKLLGGDFDNLDPTALAGLSRENGDLNYIYGMLRFMSDNADVFGKVFSWEEGQTFDCGKIGTYIESLPEDDPVHVFYDNYILGNDIQASFTGEVAREMGYSILEGDTLDDVINNGVKAWIGGMLKNNGIISEEAERTILDDEHFNLRTTDIYQLVKDLVAVVMDDNRAKMDTLLHLYLDNYLRIALNAAFGYTPVAAEGVSADADAVKAAFTSVYDLSLLAERGETSVIYRADNGKYYRVTLSGASIASVSDLTFENLSGIEVAVPEIAIFTGNSEEPVKEYVPAVKQGFDASAYAPKIYTAQSIEGLPTAGTTLPDNYQTIVDTTEATPMQDFIKVVVTQNGEETLRQTVAFAELKAFAESIAKEAGNKMAAQMSGTVNSVDITLSYNGYVTPDAFIAQVLFESATANITMFGSMTTDVNITDMVKGLMPNPIASVVVDGLAEKGSAEDASALFQFLNLDYAVDYSDFLDLVGNYDRFNGVVGQSNHILYGLVKMLLSPEGFASLGLTDGDNTNLTDNIQKIATRADGLIKTAKQYMDAEGLDAYLEQAGIDSMFASSHGFNANMLYELDFSSVETVYACAAKMACDLLDNYELDSNEDLLHEIHMAIEDLTTLDQMAIALTDVLLDKAVVRVNEFVEKFNSENATDFSFTYTNTHSDAMTADARDAILSKLTSFGINVSKLALDDVANHLLNGAIDTLSGKLEMTVGDTAFALNVPETGDWQTDLNAFADRAVELTRGIILAVSSIPEDATAIGKLSVIVNAMLPTPSFFSNCASEKSVCDFEKIIDEFFFTDALNGDLEGILRLFEANDGKNKTDDCAYGVTATYSLIKASDYIVRAIFPGTVNVNDFAGLPDYTNVAEDFTSSANDRVIAANNMRSIGSVKEELVPAALRLLRESGLLPSLVFADCIHANQTDVPEIPATCVSTGFTSGVRCTDCGKWLSGHEATEKNPELHVGEPVAVEAVEPTCTQEGSTEGTKCGACGAILSGVTVVEAKGHHYEVTETVDASCTEDGYSVYTCPDCGDTYTDDVQTKLGHHYGDWAVVTEATCTQPGQEKQTCDRCGESVTREIQPLGHTDADDDGVCDVCGFVLREPTIIQRIVRFFRNIIDWFRNLFRR